MTSRLLSLAAAALVLAACGGGDAGTSNGNGDGPSAGGGDFVEARDALAQRLASIGPSIGGVPPDVQQELLDQCHGLEEWVSDDEIEPVCTALERAIERNDPGTLDIAVQQLRALED